MTSSEHYEMAERALHTARTLYTTGGSVPREVSVYLAIAQVHATLATVKP